MVGQSSRTTQRGHPKVAEEGAAGDNGAPAPSRRSATMSAQTPGWQPRHVHHPHAGLHDSLQWLHDRQPVMLSAVTPKAWLNVSAVRGEDAVRTVLEKMRCLTRSSGGP